MPLALALSAISLQATTVDLSYSASRTDHQITVTGSGELAFPTGLTAVGLADLSSFTFSELIADNDVLNQPYVHTANFGLTNLSSFDLMLTKDTVDSIFLNASVATGPESSDVLQTPVPGFLAVTDLDAFGYLDPTVVSGSSPTAITPEPGHFAEIGLGLIALAARLRKKRM